MPELTSARRSLYKNTLNESTEVLLQINCQQQTHQSTCSDLCSCQWRLCWRWHFRKDWRSKPDQSLRTRLFMFVLLGKEESLDRLHRLLCCHGRDIRDWRYTWQVVNEKIGSLRSFLLSWGRGIRRRMLLFGANSCWEKEKRERERDVRLSNKNVDNESRKRLCVSSKVWQEKHVENSRIVGKIEEKVVEEVITVVTEGMTVDSMSR